MIVAEIIFLVYFTFVTFYSFFLSVAALFFRTDEMNDSRIKHKIAVLIPAYREDGVIVGVAKSALQQTYPADHYDVVVIADTLQADTIANLRQLPITLIEVAFDKSTKVKSLNAAMAKIGDEYEFALVLDADNIMEAEFLQKLNSLIVQGYRAIQAERRPKNAVNSMSVLDGLSERINNFIYRQGHVAAGLSSSLIGSGMIFEYAVLKNILSNLNSIGGFDRELELDLIRKRIHIHYGKNVVVYDEKVENTRVFESQRKRWLSSQFIYLGKYFREGIRAFWAGDMRMFNSAILKNIQLPRVLNLGLLAILSVLTFIFREHLATPFYIWPILLLLNIAAIAFAIPRQLYNRQMMKSVLLLPIVFFKMFTLLFKLKGANKTFIHTPHGMANMSEKKG
jgi:cellulose synthase/poly-beta-1,6-N-acetylglucosamine synthase-like glycosyltransferase